MLSTKSGISILALQQITRSKWRFPINNTRITKKAERMDQYKKTYLTISPPNWKIKLMNLNLCSILQHTKNWKLQVWISDTRMAALSEPSESEEISLLLLNSTKWQRRMKKLITSLTPIMKSSSSQFVLSSLLITRKPLKDARNIYSGEICLESWMISISLLKS